MTDWEAYERRQEAREKYDDDPPPRACSCNQGGCDICENLEPEEPEEENDEPRGPDDMSDDAEALASAGRGTDEDYGYYGEGEDY